MAYNKFRPQDMPKIWTIRNRLKGYDGSFNGYNFQTRVRWYPAGYKLNKQTISRTFSRLHYLACHSPKKVAIKYKVVYNNFEARHFASRGDASFRYLNKWTTQSWL